MPTFQGVFVTRCGVDFGTVFRILFGRGIPILHRLLPNATTAPAGRTPGPIRLGHLARGCQS
jgi:hypothetical protein